MGVSHESRLPKSIKLNRSSVTMTAGTTYKLYATITPSNAKNKTVSWSSSKPSVAGMASGGVIKEKKAGTCTITAKTHNGKKVTCKVTVKSAVVPKSIKLNKSSVTITAGNTAKLYATITPSNATNKSVTWSSSNSSVASVSGGKITAKKAGSCNITAKTSNGKKATCKVTVKAKPKTVAVTGIKLNASSVTITAGKTYKLVATISPSNATNKKFTWYYSDSAVATVSGNGVVTAKKPGTCTITAKTPNGKKATCKVTVKAADKYVTNFNKLRTYINNHGKYDSDGYKYVDILGDSDTYLVLTNLPGGAIQYVCYEHIDEYRVLTTVTWNLNKSNICQFHTSVLNTFTSNIIYNVYANINVRSYNGSNATFSNNTDLARANLNIALDWLDIYTKHLIGVSVQNLGFINYY